MSKSKPVIVSAAVPPDVARQLRAGARGDVSETIRQALRFWFAVRKR